MIPGSALRKLEAITGLRADKIDTYTYRLHYRNGVILYSHERDEKEACAWLRDMNWRTVSIRVFEAQGWLCKQCGERRPLQCHHVKFRSRWKRSDGPLDVESNVIGLCAECHQKEH